MNLSKVKNYIIIILVIANSILAGLFAVRSLAESASIKRADAQLIELLAAQGIIVTELPEETVTSLVLLRDIEAERVAATAALGEADMRELASGFYQYQNENGVATFRGVGRFEISFNNSAVYDAETRGSACHTLLVKMGFLNVSEGYDEHENENGGVTLTFWQGIEKNLLFNARAVFEFSGDGQLLSVSGTLALGTAQPADRTECKSAGAALLLFSVSHDIEVESIELGYRLKPLTAESVLLTPEWRVADLDSEYYLDGFTGALIAAED